MSYTFVPRIINPENTPGLFMAEGMETDGYDIRYDTIPFSFRLGDIPDTLPKYTDPAFVRPPQKYEHRYVNDAGVDVVVKGSYEDVMSTIAVLRSYPPKKKECGEEDEYVDLFGDLPPRTASIPKIGVSVKDKHILVRLQGKVYSGSGLLIMVNAPNRPMSEAKFILFRSTVTGKYEDLGGRIDKPQDSSTLDETILFRNAAKEAKEESQGLFNIEEKSTLFVDIQAGDNRSYYRMYLYPIEFGDPGNLANLYDQNRAEIKEYANFQQYKTNYGDAYDETDRLELFDHQTFLAKLRNYDIANYGVTAGVFQSVTGNHVQVRGRTMKTIAKLDTENIISGVVTNNTLMNVSIAQDPTNNSKTIITI